MFHRSRVLALLSVIVAFASVAAPNAVAAGDSAPQALALVATARPAAVACDRAGCRVRLSSFCLERDRDAPETGQAYRLAAGALTLVVAGEAGVRRLPLPAGAQVTADRSHSSVTVRLPAEVAARWPAARLALAVGPMTTLLPLADGRDVDRHDAAQVAAVTGPLRAVGRRIVDDGDERVVAVRLLNQAVNRLPVVTPERGDGGEAIWRQVLAEAPARSGRALAGEAFEACHRGTRQGLFYNIRNCLILRHDRLMDDLNQAYWDAVAGS